MSSNYSKYGGLGGGGGGGSGTVTSVSVVTANGLAGTVATATTTPAITLSTTITGLLKGNGTAISAQTTGDLTDVGTDGITVTGGTGSVIGSGTSLSQHVADTTHNGYLSSTDWNTFNSKQSALTLGTLSDVGTDGITVTGGTNAVIGSGTSLSQHVADTTHNGYLSSTDWNTFNGKQASGSYITALTGDITASGPGSVAATLATVNSNVGSFGSSTAVPSFTVNGKGLITAASTNVVIAPAGTLTGTTLAANVISSSLTSVGTITSGTWNGTVIDIAHGGTNNGALAVTAGGTLYTDGSKLVNVGAGTSGQVLTSNGASAPTWTTVSGTGTVTSVNLTAPALFSVTGNPVTTSGTLALAYSGTALPTANGGTSLTSSGAAGNALISNGSTWISAPISGSSAFAAYASSQVTTVSTTTLTGAFQTFNNSPAFTFTPTITGTYKVYCSGALDADANSQTIARVFNTTGGATLLEESQAILYGGTAAGGGQSNEYFQSVYTLTAGTSYVFDIQGKHAGTGGQLDATLSPFYMFAEGISLPGSVAPSMRYYSSSTTISGSLATIVYATLDYDNFSGYSSGTYTVPSGGDGKYQIDASLLITGTVSLNNTLIMEIQKNGSVVSRRTIYLPAALTDGSVQIGDIISCVPTDTLRIQVSTSAVGPSIVSSNFDNYLSICKVG